MDLYRGLGIFVSTISATYITDKPSALPISKPAGDLIPEWGTELEE